VDDVQPTNTGAVVPFAKRALDETDITLGVDNETERLGTAGVMIGFGEERCAYRVLGDILVCQLNGRLE
jgi:hypothetical protein